MKQVQIAQSEGMGMIPSKIAARPEAEINAIARFAAAHYESALAYELASDQCHVRQMLQEDLTWGPYRVVPLYAKSNQAFAGFVLIPSQDKVNSVRVIFQGTVLSLDREGIGHLNMNLEASASAAQFWAAEGNDIMQQFFDIINADHTLHDITNISVSGHSRGAGLTQYFTTSLLEKINEHHLPVTTLKNAVFNNTGPNLETINKFKEQFSIIKQNQPDFKFDVLIGHVHGDPIQQTGQGTIYDDLSSQDAKIEMIKIDKDIQKYWAKAINFDNGLQIFELINAFKNLISSALIAHTHDAFFAPLTEGGMLEAPYQWDYFTNETPAGASRIKDELRHKSHFFQKILEPFKNILHFGLDLFKESHEDLGTVSVDFKFNKNQEVTESRNDTEILNYYTEMANVANRNVEYAEIAKIVVNTIKPFF